MKSTLGVRSHLYTRPPCLFGLPGSLSISEANKASPSMWADALDINFYPKIFLFFRKVCGILYRSKSIQYQLWDGGCVIASVLNCYYPGLAARVLAQWPDGCLAPSGSGRHPWLWGELGWFPFQLRPQVASSGSAPSSLETNSKVFPRALGFLRPSGKCWWVIWDRNIIWSDVKGLEYPQEWPDDYKLLP